MGKKNNIKISTDFHFFYIFNSENWKKNFSFSVSLFFKKPREWKGGEVNKKNEIVPRWQATF